MMSTAAPDPDALTVEANRLVHEAAADGDLAGFDAAISRYATVVAITPAGHQHLGIRLSNLGYAYFLRYVRSGQDEDGWRAVQAGEQGLGAVHAGDTNTANILSVLVATYLARYQRVARPGDLDRLIQLSEWAVRAPGADAGLATHLSNLATGYLFRYESTGAEDDLRRAVEVGTQAVDRVAAGDPNRALVLNTLAVSYRHRYQRLGDRADLDRMIDAWERAVAEGPAVMRADTMRANLAIGYHDRFGHTGDLADLDQCLHHTTQVVTATRADDAEYPSRLANLAMIERARFERLGDVADVNNAIDHATRAVAATPDGHRYAATYLSNLGVLHSDRFERLGVVADLQEAVRYKERAVLATARDHPESRVRLSNLAQSYLSRFERLGDHADLDRGIARLSEAVAATPPDHPDLALYLHNLGGQLRTRFEERGDDADIDLAVHHHTRSVALTPADRPDLALRLTMLGLAHAARYSRTGDLADLDQSVAAARRAAASTPADHPDVPLRLANLANALRSRYVRTATRADLEEAVDHAERAVAATPADHAARPQHLSNLGQMRHARFERTRERADLDRAIEVTTAALERTPADQPIRATRLGNLGRMYLSLFGPTGDTADLDRAAQLVAEAADVVPHAHPERSTYLYHVAMVDQKRFDHTRDLVHIDRAINALEQAVALLPTDHPSRGWQLLALGNSYSRRQDAGGAVDAGRVATYAAQVLAATAARPFDRAHACWAAARLSFDAGAHDTARALMDSALSVLPLIAAHESDRADQEFRLGANQGLVGEAIAVHCAVADPTSAVRAAEQGRAILLAQALELRTPLTALEERYPRQAREFRRIRDGLDSQGRAGGVDRRARLRAEYQAVLAEIRGLPGFGRFLLAPEWTELRPAAAGGAVILLNAARQRSDGIIITAAGPPVHVPLPDLRNADVGVRVAELTDATAPAGGFAAELRRQRVLTEVLEWLWDTAVGPVLAALPEDLTRVWWVPVGRLGLLPVHAAGRAGEPGALDRVVSSYTPTLRALARARARPVTTARRQLTIALARAPGQPDLPATVAEATALHARHPGFSLLTNENATIGAVTTALADATWAHFACHASIVPTTPSAGGLHLYDGMLPVAEVGRRDLPEAELAYLSACSTSHVDRRHADESIHLASAFQLAGFRHVIASLWPLDDQVAAEATEQFYRLLPAAPTADDAAQVLREVVHTLRTRYRTQPHLWAALIHSGP